MDRWQDSLENEDLRTNPVLDRYKTPEDAYQAVIEQRATLGRSVVVPPDDATPDMMLKFDQKLMEKVPGLVRMPSVDDEEDSKRFWNNLGVPVDVDGYEKPEGIDLPDDMVEDLTKIAFESGMTQEQYAKYLTTYSGANGERMREIQAHQQAEVDALKREWGGAYEDNISITDTLAQKFDIPSEGLTNAQRLGLLKMAQAVSSDPQVFNQINNPSPRKTPAEIRARVDDIRDILLDKKVPIDKRRALLSEQNKLYEELDRYG